MTNVSGPGGACEHVIAMVMVGLLIVRRIIIGVDCFGVIGVWMNECRSSDVR